ncbi:MAG TPA: DUF2281 domain-containing protein [Blastocatellia bacterium]|nr:DUF2281 domain-containing protein [Blastocatellia bacterium]
MQAETDVVINLIETEFQKLSLAKQKELLQSLINKLGVKSEATVPTTDQRIPGLQQGKVWMSDDFDDELPDEFWGDRV